MNNKLFSLLFLLLLHATVRGNDNLRPVSINPAEAVVATFLEESMYKPESWTLLNGTAHGLTMQRDYRMFHGAMFQWLRRPASDLGFSMSKAVDIYVHDFDNLIVAAVIPDGGRFEIKLETDKGERVRSYEKLPGNKREYVFPLESAAQLTGITLSVYSAADGLQGGAVLWIMLQNEEKLGEYLASLTPFGKEWTSHIQPESYRPSFEPTYGLVFGKDQLEDIRARHRGMMNPDGSSSYIDNARRLMAIEPEDIVKESVGNNIRFARDRDLELPDLKPSDLAIAGILMKDKEMLRMAARYAMVLATTPHWDEGFMAHLPGSNWVHAAFRESWAAHELAITLDLAGEMFTDLGRKFILKRLAIDGIGHINYITWSAEYIHRMNQMSVFSHGRILVYALLEQTMPRVKPYIELAYNDLVNSLQTIILPDGGNVEGPGYMAYTIREAGLALYYYAMATGKPLAEVIPSNIRNTSAFAEALWSTTPACDMIPICDSDPWIGELDALSFLANVSGDSRWIDIYQKAKAREDRYPEMTGQTQTGLLALVIPEENQHTAPTIPAFVNLPDMGIMASTRRIGDERLKILIMGNKARAGHTHEDKGSFVLEFAGEVFAGDFGRATYGTAMTFITKQAQWHNMLIPVVEGERPAPKNPIVVDVKPIGQGSEEYFEAVIDATPGWENYYSKYVRRWSSPTPSELLITDNYELAKGKAVEFHWQTMLPVERKGNIVRINGERGSADIHIPQGTTCRIEEHTWWDGRVVHRIIFTKKSTSGEIQTHVTFKLNTLNNQ